MKKYTETDIWKDPRVVEALKEGRGADDIMILDCRPISSPLTTGAVRYSARALNHTRAHWPNDQAH